MAGAEQICLRQRLVKHVQLLDKGFDVDLFALLVEALLEDEVWVLARFLLDIVEKLPQRSDALLDDLRRLEVRVAKLNLFKHGERDRINEDHTAVHTTGVHDQDLLVAFLK